MLSASKPIYKAGKIPASEELLHLNHPVLRHQDVQGIFDIVWKQSNCLKTFQTVRKNIFYPLRHSSNFPETFQSGERSLQTLWKCLNSQGLIHQRDYFSGIFRMSVILTVLKITKLPENMKLSGNLPHCPETQ